MSIFGGVFALEDESDLFGDVFAEAEAAFAHGTDLRGVRILPLTRLTARVQPLTTYEASALPLTRTTVEVAPI